MIQKRLLFLIFLFLLGFSACQKQETTGGRDYKILGSSAHDLLASSRYSFLQIQIEYMPGYAVDSISINNLVSFLEKYLNKPDGIQVIQQQIASMGKAVLSLPEIVSVEKKNRTIFTTNNAIGVYILITDGKYTLADNIATSYWNTSICVFGKTIHDNSGGWRQISRTELLSLVLEHEFGHLLGLVNQGSPMQVAHKDPINGAHCINPDCLMYFERETSAIGGTVSFPSLDSNCLRDLELNGGK